MLRVHSLPPPPPPLTYLSQSGLALEEVGVLAALWRVEFGVEEGAAVGDGLEWGGALVGEGKTHKQLQRRHISRADFN